ncbi:M28 family peptidase [Sphaerobacter thermophilus]|uniref:Peptidase M28 n=1 Tax=Sphaerobacter thermophilus (strain ATCC 49802 / DSM 20745 / KCCM 41009 / NCIMB 13125 / S 6022) TaxID=479434 RepID=D1C866_SPHTD|nr:M28 family peptidase [Sphaerobacter thermophilus]ACZ40009.1 peptidase M28 [Sphaerobacter thermophilus DSM 20745]
MVDATLTTLEQALRDEISAERLKAHLEVFSRLFRDSGTEDERRAAEYIAERMREYGVATEILEFDGYISWPREGTLTVFDDKGGAQQIPVRTRSFGASTPPEGIEAELVFIPFNKPAKGEMIFSHRAVAGDYTGRDVRGKIVLTADGGPDGVRRAQERGALAHIHIWPSDEPVIHEMIATSIWGTPTRDSAPRIPRIPALGVTHADGERLREMCEAGTVRVRITSDVHTAWMRLPLVVADIPGSEPNTFLLVGAHIDSWYEGITDNATGDAALIEMARVLSKYREHLRHGVRFAWWPGHSTGRYAGSTWYADTHFMELRKYCLGYLNIDSPGVRETEIWDCRYNCGEIEHLTRAAVKELTGQDPNVRRPLKAGDQSFLGVGLPSLGAFRMLPIDHPDRKAVGGCGGGWWWHSPEDTLDKADPEILADDTRLYVTMTARMCVPALHPYDFVPVANDFINHLRDFQDVGGAHLDLTPAQHQADLFREAALRLREKAARVAAEGSDPTHLNAGMRALSRILNPALFTIAGAYEFDPALQLPVLPGLAPVQELATLDPESDDYRFLRTQLLRQRNRIEDALMQATALANSLAES